MVELPVNIEYIFHKHPHLELSEAIELIRRGFISSALVINPIKYQDLLEWTTEPQKDKYNYLASKYRLFILYV